MIPTAKQLIDVCESIGVCVYVAVNIGRGETIAATIEPALLVAKLSKLDPDARVPRARIDADGDIYFITEADK